MKEPQTSGKPGNPTEPEKPRSSTFMLEERQAMAHAPELVWAAIRDPQAYFAWNPAAKLLDPLLHVEDEMHLQMKSPMIGRFTYVHRVQAERRTVTHELPLRLRFVQLGSELHTWRVEDRSDGEAGCVVYQAMDVHLDTRAGKLLRGLLEKEMSKLLSANFHHLDTWLSAAPELAGGRFQVPDAHA